MNKIKWIGAIFGGLAGGILGAIAGFALGSVVDKVLTTDDVDSMKSGDGHKQRVQAAKRNEFLFSLMLLSAYIIKADGRIMHSEMECLRKFLHDNFGQNARQEGEEIILRLFQYQKEHGQEEWNSHVFQACQEIRKEMDTSHVIQLISFLAEVIKADGNIHEREVEGLRDICEWMGFKADLVERFLALGKDTLESAYKVLGVSSDATDEEVRDAFRRLVRENHPDRVATLGPDIQQAAIRRMQEINEAKARIDKARGY